MKCHLNRHIREPASFQMHDILEEVPVNVIATVPVFEGRRGDFNAHFWFNHSLSP